LYEKQTDSQQNSQTEIVFLIVSADRLFFGADEVVALATGDELGGVGFGLSFLGVFVGSDGAAADVADGPDDAQARGGGGARPGFGGRAGAWDTGGAFAPGAGG
jgi:hypothetical protein